jgi:putative tricarboxylic transport membrane protein
MEIGFWSTVYSLLDFNMLLLILVGTVVGLIVGVIPGLGSIQGIVLLLPLTFTMTPSGALIMLTSVYCASVFGGSIPAILFRMPGTESAVMTSIDGYQLSLKGQAGKALGTAMMCSAIGGIFSTMVLQFLAPTLANFALRFGAAEYFALGLLGVSCVSSIGTKSQTKAVMSMVLGLFIATVGIDPISGALRFTFGTEVLQTGVAFTPAIIGLFAVSELMNQVLQRKEAKEGTVLKKVSVAFLTIKELIRMRWVILRAAFTGTWVGILPGVGASTAAVIAYNQEVRLSKKPDEWGTGILEGVAAPEASNNASVGGAMVPLLGLGIPGSSTAAVLIGAFLIHGLRPGPMMFSTNLDVVYSIIGSMYVCNVLMLGIALLMIPVVIRILQVPYPYLASCVYIICVSGALVLGGFSNVWIMLLFGLLGFFLSRFGFPLSPLIIAIILGPMMETNLRRGMHMYDNGIWDFFMQPIALVLILASVLSFCYPMISSYLVKRPKRVKQGVQQ